LPFPKSLKKEIVLILQNISYTHPNRDLLFHNISLRVNNGDKIALIGNNGSGKSTLLKVIAGELLVSTGQVTMDARPYYVPQIFGQYSHLIIAEALGIEDKLDALKKIVAGEISDEAYAMLDDDWTIEERCQEALKYWQLEDVNLFQKLESLSGGQKTKVFLAGIFIHQPELILLDEPSNHLDLSGRQLLYKFIQTTQSTLIVVSHDRFLLNLLNNICELSKHGITQYGGNYNFYVGQKQLQTDALAQDVQNKESALRKAKDKQRETLERQQRLDSRGKRKQEKAGVATIMMNTLRNNAENSTAKMKSVHSEKISEISKELQQSRSSLPDIDTMKFGFDSSSLHKGKILFQARNLNFSYNIQPLWSEPLNFQIASGERIVLKGDNGSGKTTLIKLILGDIASNTGTIFRADIKSVYIDQDYSFIKDKRTVYEQAKHFNTSALQEHEIKIRLSRFMFAKEDWDKPCKALSGGEKMRLLLCCLTISNQAPDIIVLDEPTNNLDIQNVEILTNAIMEYKGTIIVVSHDETFLEEINIERIIQL